MDKIEQIARMCHQTNKAWCELNGDNSQKTGTTQQCEKDSAIKGVEFKLTTLMLEARRATQCLDEIK
jgi:hypothetical protein